MPSGRLVELGRYLKIKKYPIKKLKRQDYVSKERLVLNIINYIEIVKQDFENSSFLIKNKNLLLIFYFYEIEKKAIDFKIDIVDEWEFSEIDLEIIKKEPQIRYVTDTTYDKQIIEVTLYSIEKEHFQDMERLIKEKFSTSQD